MAVLEVANGSINCVVDDLLWPWETGTPILMHHGFARNAKFWNPWVKDLVRDFRVYRPEVRGCGDSPAPDEDFAFTAEQMAQDILDAMDQLELERVRWVGEHSGTLIGMLVATLAPERIESLVLCDAPTQSPSTTTNAIGEKSTAEAMLKYGIGHWTRETLSHRLDTALASQELQDWYVEQMAATPRHVGASLTRCFHDVRVSKRLKFDAVKAPVLLLCGDQSRFGTLEANKAFVDILPMAELRVAEGVGEGVNVVAPEFCLRESREFWIRHAT